jgi:hypothetical protein
VKHIHSRSLFLVTTLFLFVSFALASCSSWQQIPPLSEPGARGKKYTQLRVWLVDGDVHVLRDPWISGDTLYGHSGDPAGETMTPAGGDSGVRHDKGDSVAVPIERIAKAEAWSHDASKTTGLLVGIGITVVVIAIAAVSTVEAEIGGNCPRIYSWDGTTWRLDSGTYAGAIMPALARTDVDNLDFAQSEGGIRGRP